MSEFSTYPLIAVDVGNNRMKFGCFDRGLQAQLPAPCATLEIDDEAPDLGLLSQWIHNRQDVPLSWWIGSVNRHACTRLIDWLRECRREDPVTLVSAGDLPLEVAVPRPDMVGIDRLIDATAANWLRDAGRSAVVVDVGSAITVDLVSSRGVFLGGAILPGIAMSARALHEYTDLLPLIDMTELTTPPAALGTATVPAMRSGLFWGAVGAIRQLTEQLAIGLNDEPHLFLTGGAGPAVAELLGARAEHVPHLTLAGIALIAEASEQGSLEK
jgi:type III pantothenate kinase